MSLEQFLRVKYDDEQPLTVLYIRLELNRNPSIAVHPCQPSVVARSMPNDDSIQEVT